ncbi:hypothetical protein ACIA5C_10205 [Actinoplanes sp. NPDC051343]|uniref:hypothetical protein n=1 Tax=Actinoplanes sp. NPDC051343 TaxID=3363906 RepID=UPI0037A31673
MTLAPDRPGGKPRGPSSVHEGSAAAGGRRRGGHGGREQPGPGLINDPENPPPDLAQPDKEWLAYDPTTRTAAVSYTRFFFGDGGQSGNGQIELVRAHLPAKPSALSAADLTGPAVVWPE